MKECLNKIEMTKYINKNFYHKEEYKFFFEGLPLEVPYKMYISRNENYILTENNDNEIGLLKIGNSISDCIEVYSFIKDYISVYGKVKIKCSKENKEVKELHNRLHKRFKNSFFIDFRDYTILVITKDKAIKNVLSIDIDILFPEMQIYQKYLDTDLSPKQSWKVIKWKAHRHKEELNFIPCRDTMMFIMNILKNKCKDSKIYKIEEHDEIINILTTEKCYNTNMYNIDNHEDVTYHNDNYKLNIENWVTFANKKQLINKYHWIGREDSIKVPNLITNTATNFKNVSYDKLPNFDLVVICKSKHFTPPKWWYLVDNLYNYVKGGKI